MKNRILHLAAAGVLALPAAAAPETDWSLYGTLLVELDNVKADGASTGASTAPLMTGTTYAPVNVPARNRVSGGGSNIGFKGGTRLSSDLKVIWQMESAIQLDGDTPTTLAGRNSGIGLEGPWGTVLVGQWDTPYKNIQQAVQQLKTTVQFDAWLLNNAGFNTPPTTTASSPTSDKKDATFSRRQGNSLQYWSPVVSGFQAKVMYSVNEGKPASSATAPQASPWVISANLTYKVGPLTAMYAYERHHDYFGLNRMLSSTIGTKATSKDEGHELGLFLNLPSNTRVTAVFEQLKYQTDGQAATLVNEYKRFAWHTSVAQSFGAHKVWLAYGSAAAGSGTLTSGAAVTTDGLGAQQYTLGYSCALNKATDAFAAVYGMKNDKSAQYGLYPQVTTLACGADTKGMGLGLVYKF